MATATKIQLVEFNKYEVRTVPTLILVDDEGNVVKRHSGLLGVQELKEFCNEAN